MESVYTTERLVLRQHTLDDSVVVEENFQDIDIVRGILSLSYPCPKGVGEEWLKKILAAKEAGSVIPYAITFKDNNEIIGSISVFPNKEHKRGHIGYWLAKAHWGKGIVTEAAKKLLDMAFKHCDINRLEGTASSDNPASIRVLEKMGMKYEATLRSFLIRFDEVKDVVQYSILREEYEEKKV